MFGKNRTAQDTLGNDRELLLQAMDKIIAGDFSEVSAEGFRDPIYAEKLNQWDFTVSASSITTS